MKLMPSWLVILSAAAFAAFAQTPGRAQDAYPTQVVKIIVPSAAGSTTDTLARLMADQFGKKWGKPVVVENIAGGGMNTGTERVARAAPDGHTLLVAPPGPLTRRGRVSSSCPSSDERAVYCVLDVPIVSANDYALGDATNVRSCAGAVTRLTA